MLNIYKVPLETCIMSQIQSASRNLHYVTHIQSASRNLHYVTRKQSAFRNFNHVPKTKKTHKNNYDKLYHVRVVGGQLGLEVHVKFSSSPLAQYAAPPPITGGSLGISKHREQYYRRSLDISKHREHYYRRLLGYI